MDDVAFDSMKDSSRRLLGGEPKEKTTRQDIYGGGRISGVCCPSLSWRNRLFGFWVCLAGAFCLTFGSMFRIVQLLWGFPLPFAIYYSLGSAIGVCSSFFLSGPWKQLKRMFSPVRVATLGLTLFVVLSPGPSCPDGALLF